MFSRRVEKGTEGETYLLELYEIHEMEIFTEKLRIA